MMDFDVEDEEFEYGEDVDEDINLLDLEKSAGEAPVVKLVNLILIDAIRKKASDIHIEPYEKKLRIRYRIDGILYEVMKPPIKLKNAITSRVKIMSNLDIAERRLPQDGRIKMKMGRGQEMDFGFLFVLLSGVKKLFFVFGQIKSTVGYDQVGI